MTVKELREALAIYPDDVEVYIHNLGDRDVAYLVGLRWNEGYNVDIVADRTPALSFEIEGIRLARKSKDWRN